MIAKAQYQISAADVQVVLALVRGGTLAGAGTLLGVDGSTVFRTLQRIERGVRQRLFERSRAGYQPTETGLQLARHAEKIEAEIEAARGFAAVKGSAVSGTVRISTTDTVLHGLVMPALRSLAAAHALLRFDLTASNELASLTRRDADIAVRATKKPPGHLIGRHLGPIRVALFAPALRGRRPARPADPLEAPWVAPDDALPEHPSVQWRKRHHPRVVPQVQVNSILSVLEAVAAGLGIGVVPLFLAQGRKDVVAISAPIDECETQLWLLTHPESRHLRRIATVAAHLAEHMALT